MTQHKEMEETIELPENVTAQADATVLTMKGPKGEARKNLLAENITIRTEGNKVILHSAKSSKREGKKFGSFKAHINNMVKGVQEGHSTKLKVLSGHFPISASVSGNEFTVKNFFGEKTPRKLKIPDGVKVEVKGNEITVEGADREAVGNTAAALEKLTYRPNFDRRIFQDGIIIVEK